VALDASYEHAYQSEGSGAAAAEGMACILPRVAAGQSCSDEPRTLAIKSAILGCIVGTVLREWDCSNSSAGEM
jgi:hypothetical protein